MSDQQGADSASPRAGVRAPPSAGVGGERARGADRAQTTLDFAIGISVFLSVMLFVFAFVPGILQPFNLAGEENIALSERIASDLSQGKLGNASEPYVLESSCTVAFFDEGTTPPTHCDFGGTDVHERLGVTEGHNLNVTMEGALDGGPESSLVCWDKDEEDLDEVTPSTCGASDDVMLSIGGAPPEANDATVTARRVVSLQRQNVTMKVVVW